MNHTIYTIGYSGFKIEKFIAKLKENSITVVIDVRSTPYSKRFTDYNRERIACTLSDNGILYENFAEEFGARQREKCYYAEDGYMDFALFTKSERFREGMQRLAQYTKAGHSIVLMCTETQPIECHRCIMVSRACQNAGYNIVHLLPKRPNQITQKDVEQQLLQKYSMSETDIGAAYQRQNEVIGYYYTG